MLRASLVSSVFLSAVLAACGDGPGDEGEKGQNAPLAVDAEVCSAAMPGPPLAAGAIDGDPNLLSLLGSIDISRAPNPTMLGEGGDITYGLANYMLGRANGASVTHEGAKARGGLGRSVLAAAVNGTSGALDWRLLRAGLYRYSACERGFPRTLSDLRTRYGDYTTWDSLDVPCSRAKGLPRRIHEGAEQGVYVAETIADGVVRETEVIFTGLRTDGQLDFAAYTDRGELTNRSTFATGSSSMTLAAPFACMSCHLDRETGTYSVRMPTGVGAGCQHP